jgi:DNA-binding NarL/FixJ family response regulator
VVGSSLNFEVVGLAATVSDASRLAQNTSPDIAIFDVRLGRQADGNEGAIQLRRFLDIPVVFLTVQDDEGSTRAQPKRPIQPRISTSRCIPQIITAIEEALGKPD